MRNACGPQRSAQRFMDNGIHFISGLPRSGSTLLSALLRQNPRFNAGISTPLAGLYHSMQSAMSSKNEMYMFISDHQREQILRGLFTSFYAGVHESKLVFDTNRHWCSKLSGLAQLHPRSRVLCCVRSLAWILDSFERLVQKNPLELSRLFNYEPGISVFSRVESIMGPAGMLRAAHDGLQEAFCGEHADRILLIQYESLARFPEHTLAEVYAFLGEAPFAHDFENVQYEADEYDRSVGTPGLHRVRRGVSFEQRATILPLDIFARYEKPFWKDQSRNVRNVRII
jgi:sulfotransferase